MTARDIPIAARQVSGENKMWKNRFPKVNRFFFGAGS
jgi:hypothetical protein